MRYHGRITTWKDDQGFGFITPNGGGEPIFLHIKTFSNRQRRPVGNEIVTYELTVDERRRPRAVNVAFVGARRIERSTAASGWGPTAFVALFLAFVVGAVFVGKLPLAVLGVYFGGESARVCCLCVRQVGGGEGPLANPRKHVASIRHSRWMARRIARPKGIPPQVEEAGVSNRFLGNRVRELCRTDGVLIANRIRCSAVDSWCGEVSVNLAMREREGPA
jgi:cold shock CspA family protein